MKKYGLLVFFILVIFGIRYFNSFFQSQQISKEVINYIKNNFDSTVINYFEEIAFETEYGGGREIIRKWNKDSIFYFIKGNPNVFDSTFVISSANKLNSILINNKLCLSSSIETADIAIDFVIYNDAKKLYPNIDKNTRGQFIVNKQKYGELRKVSICIITNYFKNKSNYHVILEEFVQSLGLMNDSFMYPKSLFYDYENEADSLSPIDIKLLRILYNSGIKSGVTRQHFEEMMEYK